MTHVITRACCNDAACVPVCPVNCIHPTPDEPDYGTAEMLYIDPNGCIDCQACVEICPVSAIVADYDLEPEQERYLDINARWFENLAHTGYEEVQQVVTKRAWDADLSTLRVAVIGSGPAACYAAEEIAGQRGIETSVDIFERLLTPGGLVRFGVAPDHQDTKRASDAFLRTMRRPNVRVFLNTEVGVDVTLEQLTQRYHAVIYAVGAMSDRSTGIPGEDLPGSHSATEFVAWYNGHPDYADRTFDLSSERAVVIGNGNVALDVARILAAPIKHIERTDIADHAVEALRASNIREVVVVGRRGPLEAAFTTPELLGLAEVSGLDVVVRPDELAVDTSTPTIPSLKAELLAEVGTDSSSGRSVALRFLASPAEVVGDDRVTGIRLALNRMVERDGSMVAEPTGETEELDCGLVLRSVGYRGRPSAGLPFDDGRGVIPNVDGRVVDGIDPVPGLYVTGWIKRGPSGVIGTNKKCAKETAAALMDDFRDGKLVDPTVSDDIADLLPEAVDVGGWKLVDDHEKKSGREQKRPRVKVVDHAELLSIATGVK